MDEHGEGPFCAAASPERASIRRATMELVVERGYDETSVEMVIARAGIPRVCFDRDFDGLRDCCRQIYLANVAEFDRAVFREDEGEQRWRDRLRATAYRTARYLRDHPLETRFDITQVQVADEVTLAYRDRYIERIVDLIDDGRQELEDPGQVSRAAAEGVLGSIYEMLARRLASGDGTSSAEEYVPELMYIAVRPYLGHEVAREELSIPPPLEPNPVKGRA